MNIEAIRAFVLTSSLVACPVIAEVCDYAPSKLAGAAGSALAAGIGGGVAAAGAGMQAAGFYTLVHATSGLTMLGSTAAGASAAGTVGIMAGTAGAAGTAAAILMAPVTIVVGAATAISVAGLEAACYFQVERVTDPYIVRGILESGAHADPAVDIVETADGPVFRLGRDSATAQHYYLRNLYIADGHLKHDDWFIDSDLGAVVLTLPDAET